MQNGSITLSERHHGPDVWEYRWREPGADGRRKHRRIVIGTINQFADKAAVFRATSALRRDINMASVRCKGKPVTLSQLADHYGQRELASSNRWKTHSTKMGYRGYLRKWIIPRWGILGFTVFGVDGGEIMSAVQIAMIAGLPYTALRDAILAHPTLAEGLVVLFSSASVSVAHDIKEKP